MRVFLTGATGFVGSHLAAELRSHGHAVRALVRETSDTRFVERLDVEIVRGSLSDAERLAKELAGCDAIVHAAGGGRYRTYDDLVAQNVATTRTLLAATLAAAPRPRRFVLISSLAAHGPSTDGQPRDATSAPAPVSLYGRSKVEAERLALRAADEIAVAIVRPPVVYGPRDDRMLALFRAVSRGILPLWGRGATTSVIYVEDCASAVRTVLEAAPEAPSIFALEDGAPHAWEEIGGAIAKALGRRPVRLPIPTRALSVAAFFGEAAARLRDQPAFLSRDKARDAAAKHWVCDASALRALGWAPRVPLEDGIARTLASYREDGLL